MADDGARLAADRVVWCVTGQAANRPRFAVPRRLRSYSREVDFLLVDSLPEVIRLSAMVVRGLSSGFPSERPVGFAQENRFRLGRDRGQTVRAIRASFLDGPHSRAPPRPLPETTLGHAPRPRPQDDRG